MDQSNSSSRGTCNGERKWCFYQNDFANYIHFLFPSFLRFLHHCCFLILFRSPSPILADTRTQTQSNTRYPLALQEGRVHPFIPMQRDSCSRRSWSACDLIQFLIFSLSNATKETLYTYRWWNFRIPWGTWPLEFPWMDLLGLTHSAAWTTHIHPELPLFSWEHHLYEVYVIIFILTSAFPLSFLTLH